MDKRTSERQAEQPHRPTEKTQEQGAIQKGALPFLRIEDRKRAAGAQGTSEGGHGLRGAEGPVFLSVK